MVELIDVVIGLNYGDEGKGNIVDKLHISDAVVIKHNGGGQAGHTALSTDQTKKFVYSQYGSSTHRGAMTYLAPTFIVDPPALQAEYLLLREKFYPEVKGVSAHPACRVVTRYDSAFNKIQERVRGEDRHGSCGRGINATRLRNKSPANGDVMALSLSLNDVVSLSPGSLRDRLDDIRKYYLHELRSVPKYSAWVSHFSDSSSVEEICEADFNDDVLGLFELHIAPDVKRRMWTFETGQGVMLDMKNTADFPHLTPSNTDVSNSLYFIDRWLGSGKKISNLVYCTRPYVTRHGAGPLPNEVSFDEFSREFPNFSDATNAPNDWQGSMRFALYDEETIKRRHKIIVESSNHATATYVVASCVHHGKDSVRTYKALRDGFLNARKEYGNHDSYAVVDYSEKMHGKAELVI